MCGVGGVELIILLVVMLLVLGPKRLPELAKALGKGLRSFNKLKNDLQSTVQADPALNNALREVESLRQGLAQTTKLGPPVHRPKGRLDPVSGKIVPFDPSPESGGADRPAAAVSTTSSGGAPTTTAGAPKDGSDVGRAG